MAVPGLRPGGKLLWVCIHQAVALLYLPELCQAGKQPARQLALCPLQPNAAIFHTYFREAIFLQSLSGGQVLHTHRCECREATYPWRNKKQDRRLRKKQCQTGYVASRSAVRSGDRDLWSPAFKCTSALSCMLGIGCFLGLLCVEAMAWSVWRLAGVQQKGQLGMENSTTAWCHCTGAEELGGMWSWGTETPCITTYNGVWYKHCRLRGRIYTHNKDKLSPRGKSPLRLAGRMA